MRLGPREQIIAAIALVVLVIALIGGLLIYPQWQRNSELASRVSQAQADVQTAKGLLAVRVASKNHAADTDAKWLRLANLVPDGPDQASLIVELQDTAFASGVQLIGITPSPPTAGATYYTIPMTLQVIGTWSDTVDFMERVLKLNRGLRITESSSVRTSNQDQLARENSSLPDYALMTSIKIEAYMIPSGSSTSTPAPAPAPTH